MRGRDIADKLRVTYQRVHQLASVAGEEFQLWKLKVEPGHTATLTCEDGNGKTVYSKAIEWIFRWRRSRCNFTNKTILLPSEY